MDELPEALHQHADETGIKSRQQMRSTLQHSHLHPCPCRQMRELRADIAAATGEHRRGGASVEIEELLAGSKVWLAIDAEADRLRARRGEFIHTSVGNRFGEAPFAAHLRRPVDARVAALAGQLRGQIERLRRPDQGILRIATTQCAVHRTDGGRSPQRATLPRDTDRRPWTPRRQCR
jgi:hypothetical protein